MTFKKGQSGNPNGRPKGVVDKRIKLRDYLEPHGEDLIQKAVQLALDGDINALRLCIERLIPKACYESIELTLKDEDMTRAQSIMKAGALAIQDVANGKILPEQGEAFINILKQYRDSIVLVDLEGRLKELEALYSK